MFLLGFEVFFKAHLLLSLGIEITETPFWNQLKIRKGERVERFYLTV